MRGTYCFCRAFPVIHSSPHPSVLRTATFPRGEGERPTFCQAHISGQAAQEGPRVVQTHPCFSPYLQAGDLLLKREPAPKAAPETFLWGPGAAALRKLAGGKFLAEAGRLCRPGHPSLRAKRNVPQKAARPDVQLEITLCQLSDKHFPSHIHNMDIGLNIM